jgi:hypothetical protein
MYNSEIAYMRSEGMIGPESNKKRFRIKKFHKTTIDGVTYKWGYGGYNFDGECNWRFFIFDEEDRKIHSCEPVLLDEFERDEVKEMINRLR